MTRQHGRQRTRASSSTLILLVLAPLASPRNYVEMMRHPIREERLGDSEPVDSPCMPAFYIIGAMKAGTTDIAHLLSKNGCATINEFEHHFWELYPAYSADFWRSGGDERVALGRNGSF